MQQEIHQDVVNIINQDADAMNEIDAVSHDETEVDEVNSLLKITNYNDSIKQSGKIRNLSV